MAIDFEKIHQEFDGLMLDLCYQCQGSCEKNEMTAFLPGEAEFIAKKLNLDFQTFIQKYANIVSFKNNHIYLSKVGICPFLNLNSRCELEKNNCKLLRCLLYPVLMGKYENQIKIFVDFQGCPMAHKVKEDFKEKAIKIYQEIKTEIPDWWLDFISEYEEAIYDYHNLEPLREKNILELAELEKCMVKK